MIGSRASRAVLAAVGVAAVAACGSSSSSSDTGTGSGSASGSASGGSQSSSGPATGTPYEIGFTADLSQQFANFGNGLKNGFTAYFNDLNQHGGISNHPVHVTTLDDQANTSKGNANVVQLVTQNKVSAIGGFLVSNNCASAAPLAASNKVPILCNASSSDLLTPVQPYLYSGVLQQAEEATPMFQMAKTLVTGAAPKAAIIYTASAASVSLDNNLKALLGKQGWNVVSDQSVPLTAADVSTQAAAIFQAQPDVVFGMLNDTVATLYERAAKSQNFNAPFITYDGATPALPAALKDPNVYILSGLVFTGTEQGSGVDQYRSVVTAAGLQPTAPFVNKGYLQGLIIGGALKTCGFPCAGPQMQAALDKLNVDAQGFTFSNITFAPDNHQPYHKMNVYHWDTATSAPVKAGGPFDGGTGA